MDRFFAGWAAGVVFMMILVLLLVQPTPDMTCSYFEDKNYVTIVDDDTCYIEAENGFVPVEDLIELGE